MAGYWLLIVLIVKLIGHEGFMFTVRWFNAKFYSFFIYRFWGSVVLIILWLILVSFILITFGEAPRLNDWEF